MHSGEPNVTSVTRSSRGLEQGWASSAAAMTEPWLWAASSGTPPLSCSHHSRR
ncbi:hypothetical protein ABZW11_21230 [Nonomuraea sp. NPDC004580]|uniref:hypothetical protein n=1 Tax=Nonomuraea sp. NPDC004580 TaxID=3154552 RepID=UPI0033AD52AA